jgi:membrane-associated protease RseP (regulator of RpoE activity)
MQKRALVTTALMAFVVAGAAWADAGSGTGAGPEGKEKKMEKRRVVVINEDGKERVIEGDGPLVRRGYLGVGLTELTSELRTHFGAPEEAGVMVSTVEAGSPAEKAGLKVGDIISEVDGKPVRSSWELSAKVRGYEEGEQAPLEVWRDGKVQNLTASITLRERSELDMGPLFVKGGEDGPVMLRLRKMGGPDGQLIRLPGTDGTEGKDARVMRLRTPREAELEKQLKELEKRLDELEKQLKQRK